MSDNVVLNAGVGGQTAATDDCAGIQYQRIKLTDGTADSTTVIASGTGTASTSLRVNLATDVALPAGTNAIGKLAANSGVDIGDVDVTTVGTITPGTAATSLGKAEDAAHTTGDVGVMALAVRQDTLGASAGTDGDYGALKISAAGALYVNVAEGGITAYTEDAASAGAESLCLIGAVRRDTAASSSGTDGDYSTVNTDSAGRLWVNASGVAVPVTDNSGSLTVDNAGTFAVQATLQASTNTQEVVGDAAHDAAAAGNPVLMGAYASAAAPTDVSADADVVRLWALRNGAQATQATFAGVLASAGNGASGTGVQRVTIANDSTGILATVSTVTTLSTLTGGAVAHDGADSGNPVKVGAKCSLTLSDDTIVANADRTDLTSDGDGALLVRPQFPLGDLISERVSNTDGSSTASTNFGAVASTRSYITAYSIFRTDAGTTPIYVDFRDGTGGSVLWSVVLPPNGGANLASAVPLFRTSANTALAFDVSAATTTVYLSYSGFKSKV